MSAKNLVIAIDRDDADELAIVLSFTNEGINDIYDGGTPLWHAINKYTINVEIVERLLEAGADPNVGGVDWHGRSPLVLMLDESRRDIVELFVRFGVDLNHLEASNRLKFLWDDDYVSRSKMMDSLSHASYESSRYKHYGLTNPERLTDEFKCAATRTGYPADTIVSRFGEKFTSAYYDPLGSRGLGRFFDVRRFGKQVPKKNMLKNQPGGPVWCADRYGQCMTMLEDRCVTMIGGAHEMGGDAEFCIYNDVIVISPDGQIEVYGYPPEVFPPTDFHTATRVGEWIYIIGSLGYQGTQPDEVSVYRLSLQDYHIEQCPTTGDVPPQMCRHSAKLIDGHNIRTWGGKWSKPFSDRPNDHYHELDLNSMEWRRGAVGSTGEIYGA